MKKKRKFCMNILSLYNEELNFEAPKLTNFLMKIIKHLVAIVILFNFTFVYHLFAQVKTIVIDAGHGGKDPGAISKILKEKDITLSIALKLGELIKKNFNDVKVIYTRSTDKFVELYKRAEIANSAKADLFVSIHVNSSKKPDPNGTETYVMGLSKTDENLEVAMTENAVILKEDDYKNKYEGFDPRSPEAYIIFSLYQNANMDLGITFSSMIQEEYKKIGLNERGVKQASFLVLWKTTMPSVLTEVGFISNSDDAAFLEKEKNHWLIAKSIFNAFSKYKGYIEGKKYVTLNSSDLPQFYEKEDIKKDTNQAMLKVLKNNPNKNEVNTNVKSTANSENIDNNIQINKNNFQKVAENLVSNTTNDTIYFWVQLASSAKHIPINQFKVENVMEMQWDNLYKYLCGKTKSYKEALDKQKVVKKLYPDAFIVATKNGKKIPINEAIREAKK